jgi:hypothetical protein
MAIPLKPGKCPKKLNNFIPLNFRSKGLAKWNEVKIYPKSCVHVQRDKSVRIHNTSGGRLCS